MGHRYVSYLVPERNSFRSIGDVGGFCTPIFSGSHRGQVLESDANPTPVRSSPFDARLGRRIADLILQPGTGLVETDFARSVPSGRSLAQGFSGRLHTSKLLRQLAALPGPVGKAACVELTRFFPSQYDCLRGIVTDQARSVDDRAWAKTELTRAESEDAQLIMDLRDPTRLFQRGQFLYVDSTEARREELEMMLGSPNRTVRELAESTLRRYFPTAR